MRLNNALAVWSPVFAQIDLKNATLKIKDGGTNEMEVTLGEGNLVYTERQNVEYTLDRGTLDEVRLLVVHLRLRMRSRDADKQLVGPRRTRTLVGRMLSISKLPMNPFRVIVVTRK